MPRAHWRRKKERGVFTIKEGCFLVWCVASKASRRVCLLAITSVDDTLALNSTPPVTPSVLTARNANGAREGGKVEEESDARRGVGYES